VTYFPTPKNNGHFKDKFVEFHSAKSAMHTYLADRPRSSGAKLVMSGDGGGGAASFTSPVRMSDGDSYFIPPSSNTYPRIFRNSTKKFITPAAPFSGLAEGQSSACLLRLSSRVLVSPYQSDRVVAYNPFAEANDVIVSGLTGSYKYNGVTETINDLYVNAPHCATYAGIYDEKNNVWFNASTPMPVPYGYAGTIALPDGKVLFVPYDANCVAIYNPVTNTVLFGSNIFNSFGNEKFYQGRLLNYSTVIFYPHRATHAVIYNFTNDTYTLFPVNINPTNANAFAGGTELLDGRHYLVAYGATRAKILDLNNGTAVDTAGSYGNIAPGACHGCCLMDDGNVLLASYNLDVPVIAATSNGYVAPYEYITSPHNNRS
jgi:hypothetical protein